MIKLIASLKKLMGRYKDYMSSALITVASTMVMIGFIFIADANTTPSHEWMTMFIIIGGMLIMIVSLFVIRHDEKKDKTYDQTLLLYLIAATRKQGVDIDDIKEAKQIMDIIDKVNNKNKKLSLSDIEILMNKKKEN